MKDSRIPLIPYLVATILVFASLSVQDVEEVQLFGELGQAIRMTCPVTEEQVPGLEWVDFIYNSDHDPKLIYRAKDNPTKEIAEGHPRRESFSVDNSYALTLENATLTDYGEIFCRFRTEDGSYVKLKSYIVAIRGPAKCTGARNVREGGSTELSCEMSISGDAIPAVQWSTDGVEQSGDDQTTIDTIKVTLTLSPVTTQMNKRLYTCRVTIAGQVSSCQIKLNVRYVVKDVAIMPQKEQYVVGDKVNCSAKGNPTPKIQWNADISGLTVEEGHGWKSFKIPPEWEGEDRVMKCTASNKISTDATMMHRSIALEKIGSGLPVPETQEPEPEAEVVGEATPEPGNGGATTSGHLQVALLSSGLVLPAILALLMATPSHDLRTVVHFAATLMIIAVLAAGTGKTAIIIAVVVAVIVVAVIIAAIIIAKKRRSKKPKGAQPIPTSDQEEVKKNMDGKGGSPSRLSKGADRNSNGTVYYNKGPKDSTYITNTPEDLDPDTPWRRHTDRV